MASARGPDDRRLVGGFSTATYLVAEPAWPTYKTFTVSLRRIRRQA